MRRFLSNLLKENNEYSLTRVASVILILAFLLGSFYLMIKGTTWGNYDAFATFCGGGGAASQVVNKFINSRFNTPAGSWGPGPKKEIDK